MNNKLKKLSEFLNIEETSITVSLNYGEELYETENGAYYVCTYDELYELTKNWLKVSFDADSTECFNDRCMYILKANNNRCTKKCLDAIIKLEGMLTLLEIYESVPIQYIGDGLYTFSV